MLCIFNSDALGLFSDFLRFSVFRSQGGPKLGFSVRSTNPLTSSETHRTGSISIAMVYISTSQPNGRDFEAASTAPVPELEEEEEEEDFDGRALYSTLGVAPSSTYEEIK